LFGRRALPGELEPIDSQNTPSPIAPVSAQLATGNRNISSIPTTVAEAAPAYSISEVITSLMSPLDCISQSFRQQVDQS
jgi:hypothetical protein